MPDMKKALVALFATTGDTNSKLSSLLHDANDSTYDQAILEERSLAAFSELLDGIRQAGQLAGLNKKVLSNYLSQYASKLSKNDATHEKLLKGVFSETGKEMALRWLNIWESLGVDLPDYAEENNSGVTAVRFKWCVSYVTQRRNSNICFEINTYDQLIASVNVMYPHARHSKAGYQTTDRATDLSWLRSLGLRD